MRLSRPARWFLAAAKENYTRKATLPVRPFHASSRCAANKEDSGAGRTAANGNDEASTSSSNMHGPSGSQAGPLTEASPRAPAPRTPGSKGERRLQAKAVERRARMQRLREEHKRLTENRRRYTPEELKALKELYTSQQIDALLATEKAVDWGDVVTQGEMRTDPAALAYLDDLASVDPVLDKLAQGPEIKYGVEYEAKEAGAAGTEQQGRPAPQERTAAQKRIRGADEDMQMLRLSQQTGFSKEQIQRFTQKVLVQRRVANQTHMGKLMSFSVLAIAGNGNGLLGIGMGKATQAADAIRRARASAVRNIKPVHRYEGRTVYGELDSKVGATLVKLMPRAPGFGCRASHLVFEMCRVAGISDIAVRTSRSRNPMNVCKATYNALMNQKLPDDIALGRGMKMVDVRKVYYAGNA